MKKTANKGVALVLMIFLLVMSSLFGLVAFSLLAGGSQSGVGFLQSIQALGLAIGGEEWYLEQLENDADWSNEVSQFGIALGNGTFDITVNSASADTVSFAATGKVPGYFGQTVQRQVSLTAKKVPKACQFGVFWQLDGPGTRLTLKTGSGGTQISGNFWSVGSSRINSPSSVTNGIVYYGSGETIDGSGTYSTEEVQPPFPDMPAIDTTYYDNLMTDWDSRIDAADSSISAGTGNLTLTSNVDWTGQTISQRNIDTNGYDITGTNFTVTCRNFNLENNSEISAGASNFTINCSVDFVMAGNAQINANNYSINTSRHFTMDGTASINSSAFALYLDDNFDTDGTVSVAGNGYIVCSNAGQVLLHSEAGDSGVFTAAPSGGNIYFLSGDDLIVNSTQNDTTAIFNPGCFLYSRSASGTGRLLRIRNANTAISDAVIIAERRIIVEDGADITDSTLYVDYASSNSNNLLRITDSGTTVSGAVISRGRAHPSLQIKSDASVTGLVYQYGSADRGRTELDGSSIITGCLLARQLDGNSLGPATITHDLSAVLSNLPPGFSGVSIECGSWNDY